MAKQFKLKMMGTSMRSSCRVNAVVQDRKLGEEQLSKKMCADNYPDLGSKRGPVYPLFLTYNQYNIMGRYVYENLTGECVWKYWFAEQSSEQHRIADQLGIGHMVYNKRQTHDTLILYCSYSTANKLKNAAIKQCNGIPKEGVHEAFWHMVYNLGDFVEKQVPHHRGKRLRFWGEY